MRSSRGERFNSCIHAPKAIFQLPHAARVKQKSVRKAVCFSHVHLKSNLKQLEAAIFFQTCSKQAFPFPTLIHAGWKYQFFASSKLSGRLQTCWQTGTYPLRPGNLGIIGSARYSQGIRRITSTLWWFRSLCFGQWLVSFVNFGHPERRMKLICHLCHLNYMNSNCLEILRWKSLDTFGCHFQFFRSFLLAAPSIAKHIKSIPFKTTLAVNLDEIPPTRYRFDSTAPTTWPVRHRQFSAPARWMDGWMDGNEVVNTLDDFLNRWDFFMIYDGNAPQLLLSSGLVGGWAIQLKNTIIT